MKVVYAAATSTVIAFTAMAAPFAQPQSTVATTIGYKSTQYVIKPGQTAKGIQIPVSQRPVRMMVANLTNGYQGVGEVTILRVPTDYLMWVGTDYASNGTQATIERGHGANAGQHIMYADYTGQIDVQVQNSNHIQIVNPSQNDQGNATVIVTFMW